MGRRSSIAAVAASIVVMSTAACSSSGSASGPDKDPAKVTGTLRVLTPSFPPSIAGKTEFDKVVAAFHKTYPKVTVEPDFATYANLNQKISTSLASGRGYDVIVSGVGWTKPFAAKNAFADLSGLGATAQKLTAEAPANLKDQVTIDGKIYGWPVTADARALAYRKSAFIKAGLDPEKPPSSLEELHADAVKLTKKDASGKIIRPGFDFFAAPGNYRQMFVQVLAAEGKPLYADDKPNFDNPEGVKALDWMSSMVGHVQDFGQQNAAVQPMVNTGDAAMGVTFGSLDCSDKGVGQKNCDDLGYFLLKDQREIEFMGGNLASVGAQSKMPKAAWAFVEAMSTPEAKDAQAKLTGVIPALADFSTSAVVASNPASKFVAAHMPVAINEGGPASWLDVRDKFGPAIDDVLLGKRKPDEVLKELAAL